MSNQQIDPEIGLYVPDVDPPHIAVHSIRDLLKRMAQATHGGAMLEVEDVEDLNKSIKRLKLKVVMKKP
jgi:hypothetical protein